MSRKVLIGHTSEAQYILRGAWVYRHAKSGMVLKYDMLDGFVQELLTGALGASWRETPEGRSIIDRFDH